MSTGYGVGFPCVAHFGVCRWGTPHVEACRWTSSTALLEWSITAGLVTKGESGDANMACDFIASKLSGCCIIRLKLHTAGTRREGPNPILLHPYELIGSAMVLLSEVAVHPIIPPTRPKIQRLHDSTLEPKQETTNHAAKPERLTLHGLPEVIGVKVA